MITYKGWSIRAYEQRHYPPYLRFVAFATREQGGKVFRLNAEGSSLEQAVAAVKKRIDDDRDKR